MIQYQELLNKYRIKCDINMIVSIWNESNRHYHNIEHLEDLFKQIDSKYENKSINETEKDILYISALFHDIVYDVMSNNNEEKSSEMFLSFCEDKSDTIMDISTIILETATHNPTNRLSKIFCDIDMDIINRSYDDLIKWESGIYNEYKVYPSYKAGRMLFLNECLDKYPLNQENLLKLIDYVNNKY